MVSACAVGTVIVVVSLISFLYFVDFKFSSSLSGEATLILALNGDGSKRIFSGEVVEGMTILDALITSTEAGNIKFKYDFDAKGKIHVAELDSYSGAGGKNLTLYLNSQRIDMADIDKIVIKPGNQIRIVIDIAL